MTETGKELRKWGDDQQYFSEKLNAQVGPKAWVLQAPADPLGAVAACSLMYTGVVIRDLAEVTDEQRRHYLGEIQKTALAMPLEAVLLHFMVEGVTRSFTHQQVRQRTAAYAQESMRFAVVDDGFAERVALPPSLAGTEKIEKLVDARNNEDVQRAIWDEGLESLEKAYKTLVNSGMPAEEARGLLPHSITTRGHYITNLRNFQIEAGKRLCTQAQFEWRIVLAQMIMALRVYGANLTYETNKPSAEVHPRMVFPQGRRGLYECSSRWQYEELAKIFKPSCYLEGKCPFKADFDRRCSIRERVDAFAKHNIPSTEWGQSHDVYDVSFWDRNEADPMRDVDLEPVVVAKTIQAINPAEWLLNPGAAR